MKSSVSKFFALLARRDFAGLYKKLRKKLKHHFEFFIYSISRRVSYHQSAFIFWFLPLNLRLQLLRFFLRKRIYFKFKKRRKRKIYVTEIIKRDLLGGIEYYDENSRRSTIENRRNFVNNPRASLASFQRRGIYALLDTYSLRSRANKNREFSSISAGLSRSKILIISKEKWNFMREVVEVLENELSAEVQTFDFQDLDESLKLGYLDLINRIIEDEEPFTDLSFTGVFGELLAWCDIVLVEWCGLHALSLSYLLPASKRLVIRLHSIEAYGFVPQLLNWGNVDRLITVTETTQNFLKQSVKFERYGVDLRLVPNLNDLRAYDLPKKSKARKNIIMVKYANSNKDPLFTLEVLRILLESDKSWRLTLIDRDWKDDENLNAKELAYKKKFFKEIEQHQLEAYLIFKPFSQKIWEEFQHVSYIISASNREGTHESVMQAMASGCVPAIRDWPFVKKWGGALSIYDKKWLAKTPQEIAEMILKIEKNKLWKEHSKLAKAEVFAKYHKDAVEQKLKDAVLNY